jgi:hypothetical protein
MSVRYPLALLFSGLIASLTFMASSGGRASVANAGNTGAPGETSGRTCGSCHSGGGFAPLTETLLITDAGSTAPVSEYVPGQTYELTFTISANGNPSGYGFQLTALDASAAEAGTFSAPASNVKIATASLVGGRTSVEHNGVGASNSFSFQWTAPGPGAGNVTFYHTANAVNRNNASSGDNGTLGSITELPVQGGATGLFAPLAAEALQLHPSALSPGERFQVQWPASLGSLASLELYDGLGRLVQQWDAVESGQIHTLPVLPAGQAFLVLRGEQGSSTGRMMVR